MIPDAADVDVKNVNLNTHHVNVVVPTHKLKPFLALIRERLFGSATTNSPTTASSSSSFSTSTSTQPSALVEGGLLQQAEVRSSSSSNSSSSSDSTTSNVDVNQVWRQRWDNAPDVWKHFVVTQRKDYGLTPSEEQRIINNNYNYVETAELTRRARIGTTAITLTVGSISKFMLRALNTLHTHNLHSLHNAIEQRPINTGLLTISNHQSVMDDPFLLGAVLPSRILVNAQKMRWGLCSMDICFQNGWISRTLRLGKAIPIQRRGGIKQPFLRDAAMKLADGDWVHIFPEGRVRQKGMGYFKRGIGKMLAMAHESSGKLPMLLPIYHEGMERVMPQKVDSNDLESTIPKKGKSMYVVVSEPVDISHIFNRLMPECQASGGTKVDAPPCIKLYEEVADFLAVIMRLLRADARKKIKAEHDVDLGTPYEFS